MNGPSIIDNTYSKISFKDYLLYNRWNLIFLLSAFLLSVAQFALFKYLYPYINFVHGDSYEYLRAAYFNLDINFYLVGYSKFIRIVNIFTSSDTALAACQYFLIQGGTIFFLLTIFYFYSPSRLVKVIFSLFLIMNPLSLYLGNYVCSDGLFFALSLFWFSNMMWLIHKPSASVNVVHALLLFMLFTLRYNAMIYPFITLCALLVSEQDVRRKILTVLICTVLIGFFVLHTGNEYKRLTKVWQYSPFSGWQLANNAMYAYRYVDVKERKPVPVRFRELDNMIRSYYDSTRDKRKYPIETVMASTFYMWSPGMPLHRYMDIKFSSDTSGGQFKRWASMGPFYADYGMYIIKQYPAYFVRYFLYPNASKYYAPPTEFLGVYNGGVDTTWSIAREWFDYKSNKVYARTGAVGTRVLDFYSILTGIANIVFVCSFICFLILNGLKRQSIFKKGLFVAGVYWCMNAVFTILASSAALRFQSFPIILVVSFSLLQLDWLYKVGITMEAEGEVASEEIGQLVGGVKSD